MSAFWVTALCVAIGLHLFALACVCASITSACESLDRVRVQIMESFNLANIGGSISRLEHRVGNASDRYIDLNPPPATARAKGARR